MVSDVSGVFVVISVVDIAKVDIKSGNVVSIVVVSAGSILQVKKIMTFYKRVHN